MAKLTTDPDKTLDYVAFLRYLNECPKYIEQLISEIDFAYQCFMLMKEYTIPVDDEEKENFMGNFVDLILEFVLLIWVLLHRL